MKKPIFFFLFFGSLFCKLNAQNLLPNEFTLSSNNFHQNIFGLTNDDIFNITPDLDFAQSELDKSMFFVGTRNIETATFLNFGYRILEAKEFKNPLIFKLGLGLGSGLRIGNYYNFEDAQPLDTFRTTPLVTIDSVTSINAGTYYETTRNIYLNFGLDKTIFSKGLFSVELGVEANFGFLLRAQSSAYLSSFYSFRTRHSYSGVGYGIELISINEEAKNAFSIGFNLPLALNISLSKNKKFIKDVSLVLSASYGYKYYFHPDFPIFYSRNQNLLIGLKYSFSK